MNEDELMELKRERLRRLNQEKYRFYEPTGKGEEYITAVGSGEHFTIFFTAANGTGKTAASCNVLAHLMFPCGNPWFQGPLFKNWPFPKKGRIISEPAVATLITDDLKNWFPAGRYTSEKSRKQFDSQWKTDTGWAFDVMTYDQDPKEFESATLGWAWFDEPPPFEIFKATVARMRKGGIIFISATPLTNAAWFYDYIYSQDPEVLAKGKRILITAEMESACIEHGVRGFLQHEHIENIISQYDEDEKQARVYGRFQHLVGLVFKKFNREMHVIRPFNINWNDFLVYEALDPHPRTKDACLWVAVNRQQQYFIIDELWMNGLVPELAQRIKAKASNYRVHRRVIDPSALIEDQHTGKSLHSRLQSFGLSYQPGTKTREASDRRIADALDYQKKGEEILIAPELYVFDTCPRTIYEIEHYRWDDWIGKVADRRNPKERPVDKDDHMIENLGRILIQEPDFIEAELEKWTDKTHPLYTGSDDSRDVTDDDPFS